MSELWGSRPFDLSDPLPTGVTVLEASAGTGKTYTIAALAARFVADGRDLNDLLLVTFTRMATGELRERVRERLVSAEQALAEHLEGGPLPEGDELVELLAQGPKPAIEQRRERLAYAIANFDAATIATTHGFCLDVLAELGTLGDLEPDVELVESVDDLISEVTDDLYVRRFFREGEAAFDRKQAGQIVRMAVENPSTPVHPLAAAEKSTPAMRQRLALAARTELERRKRLLAVLTYDDLLTRLRDALARSEDACERLRDRYKVVLIDEFQDTDPVQWEIVRRAFGDGETTLVLIADPKQAIYAFRGADVYAYLSAARTATARQTLTVNRRSDQALIDALDALFGDSKLGHPEIAYRRVEAAPAHQEPRLSGGRSSAALRVRVVDRHQPDQIKLTQYGHAEAPSARAYVAKDLAADVVELLSSDAEIERRADDGTVLGREPVKPGDIAVLVRSHRNADLIQSELAAAGVPAVINGAGSVFATQSARDWLALLQALERPAYSPWARAAALTPLLGWSAERIALADEADLEQLHQRLHGWARVLRLRGVAALAEAISSGEQLPGRVLRIAEGERELTDLQHVAELLHEAAVSEQLGAAALTSWLRQRIADAAREGGRDELTRRLESDTDAVQVLTIHRSKGLEFPIVYCPFLWEAGRMRDEKVPVYFHDAEQRDVRAIDVGLEGGDYEAHRAQYQAEERGEDLRLMYVALTRARHQAVIWWVGSWGSRDSPLGRLLFAQDEHGNVKPVGTVRPSDAAATARFDGAAAAADGAIEVERSVLGLPVTWTGPPPVAEDLAAATFDRRLDVRWRRTSYSDITAAAHELVVGSEPELDVLADEPFGVEDAVASAELPLGAMPAGARVGTFIHHVLEATDFASDDLAGELGQRIADQQARGRVEIGEPEQVALGLAAAVSTPFDNSGLALRSLRREDRRDELSFELPLAGGDEPTGELTVAAVARALRDGLHSADPLSGYAERLADPTLRRDVRGYLTGSIDLVLRLRGADGAPDRYAIVDYKTNWLAGPDEQLTASHYRPTALLAEMTGAHYGLQALLYAAALHRYLRWRVPGYDPDRDLAGVHYLFLRGMTGPPGQGVFTWRPPGRVVAALSDVLDGISAS